MTIQKHIDVHQSIQSSRQPFLLSSTQAVKKLGVCASTLKRWEQQGKITATRTPHNHRLYDINSILTPSPSTTTTQTDREDNDNTKQFGRPSQLAALQSTQNITTPASLLGKQKDKRTYIYCRVSSKKQQGDLERQVAYLASQYPEATVITDIASGINFNRTGKSSKTMIIYL